MDISLSSEMQMFIDEKLRSGEYGSAEDVVRAGLATLQQQALLGDFGPGELNHLLAEGEATIARQGVVDGHVVFGELRRRGDERRRGRP